MDLNTLRMFVATAKYGSFTAAAERLEIPLATLSRRIRELERVLQVQLLERSVHGTRLTDAGTRLYEHASRGLEMLVDGERALASDHTQLKGYLRLSLPPSLEPGWDILSAFQRRYPHIQLQVYTSERHIDMIEDGIDIAMRIGPLTHKSMVTRQLLSYKHVLVASPVLLARLGAPNKVSDLHKFPCGVWAKDAKAIWQLGEDIFKPNAILVTNDYAHLRSRALAGDIVTGLPPYMTMEAMKNKQLVALLEKHPFPEMEINLIYPSHRHPTRMMQAYLDFAQQYIAHRK
ncbi:LysR family transcriptional regulator [Pseudomonas lactis]|uniref:LysR family transcriptional regulator n=1 Tax=Pseudomonas lactis TaxID=1615674 RepID=A0A7Y1LB23_9PSED|nr:LysR family transcriptional regulator [Pseudomonas lactis]NNA42841.1 LysR family transcriptional regulator [Pseudomonas lactis]